VVVFHEPAVVARALGVARPETLQIPRPDPAAAGGDRSPKVWYYRLTPDAPWAPLDVREALDARGPVG
jgi:hypothetical protein